MEMVDFRDRLAEGDRADRLLGLALTRIRRAGLLKGSGAQRTRDHRQVVDAIAWKYRTGSPWTA
ncbi:hypothetical protein AB0M87_02315 [Streptomyces sp. NPDC051320]|uniref:hypothetical protein n=1 Tax=Streptomyces sp. NPDC051320 TaxID=3154644 RepID=UPI0034194CD8